MMLLKNAMEYMIKKSTKENRHNSWQDFKNYVVDMSDDRRYKPQLLASRVSLDSMIVKYRGSKYDLYYNCTTKEITVDRV